MDDPARADRTAESLSTSPLLQLADWRRQVAELYVHIRNCPDPREAWRDWRETRDRLFATHPQSPLPEAERLRFQGIPCWDYDPELRLLAALVPVGDRPAQQQEIGADGLATLLPAGRTQGLAGRLGGELNLYWIAGYGGGLFLPFSDATSGVETYGGGRYLLDAIKSADLGMRDSRLVLDFNFAYHPSCVHSPDWVCPLAPPDNRLPRPVRGGERLSRPVVGPDTPC